MKKTFETTSSSETREIAAEMMADFRANLVFALEGEMGVGKTCFVQGLAMGLGIASAVVSPTFKLVCEYAGRIPLYHIDLYRITSGDQLFSLDILDYLERDGVKAVEWAERAGDLIPEDRALVRFVQGNDTDSRVIEIEATPDIFGELSL